jgi:hypothetical protein
MRELFRFVLKSFLTIMHHHQTWASADFFPGEGKNFPGGARTYFLPKKATSKILFFPKKSKNILFLAGLGRQRGGGARAPLALPCGRSCHQTNVTSVFSNHDITER